MALTAALQDLEFLVLAESTNQHLLNKDQYGSRTFFGGQALVCPGASLAQSYKRQGGITPSLLELLSWCCLRIHGLCPGNHPPYASPAVIQMLNVALIPLRSSTPASRQQHYDWLCQARDAYSLGHWELTQQTILSLESGLSGPLYDSRDMLHFRPQIAEEALGALTVRTLKTMLAADSDAFPVLVVASWNTKPAQVHREMLATRELCLAHTVGDLLAATLRSASLPWAMRYTFGSTQPEEPFPMSVMQTYMHDTEQEPSMMCSRYMPELIRAFCDDEAVRQSLLDHGGQYSKDLWNVLQSPAHRADLFRYIYLYERGGLYLDIKCSLGMPLRALLSHLAEE